MGWFSKDPKQELESFFQKMRIDTSKKETAIRNAIQSLMQDHLGIMPKREAGVQAGGTRVDLYFEHGGWENVLTLKKNLTEQKMKTLLGETVLLRTHWRLSPGCAGLRIWHGIIVSDFERTNDSLSSFVKGIGFVDSAKHHDSCAAEVEVEFLGPPEPEDRLDKEDLAILKKQSAVLLK